jgi:hypothetical protein
MSQFPPDVGLKSTAYRQSCQTQPLVVNTGQLPWDNGLTNLGQSIEISTLNKQIIKYVWNSMIFFASKLVHFVGNLLRSVGLNA